MNKPKGPAMLKTIRAVASRDPRMLLEDAAGMAALAVILFGTLSLPSLL